MKSKLLKNTSILLSIIGLIDSLYLTWLKVGKDDIQCLGGCDIVNSSEYSVVFGIPIAIYGAVAYFTILLLLILKTENPFINDYSGLIVFVISLLGVLYSAYLTYIELFILHAVCPYCVISAIVLFLLLIVSIIRYQAEV